MLTSLVTDEQSEERTSRWTWHLHPPVWPDRLTSSAEHNILDPVALFDIKHRSQHNSGCCQQGHKQPVATLARWLGVAHGVVTSITRSKCISTHSSQWWHCGPYRVCYFYIFFPMILNLPSFGHKSTGYPSRQWHDKSCMCFPIILQTKHHSYNQTNKETDKQTNKHTHSTKTEAIATELQLNTQTNKHTHSTKTEAIATELQSNKQTNKHTHSTKTKAIATELQSNKQTNKHTHSTKNTYSHSSPQRGKQY